MKEEEEEEENAFAISASREGREGIYILTVS